MTKRNQDLFRWASRVCVLLAALLGVVAAADWLSMTLVKYSALAAACLGVLARWFEQQLPAVSSLPPKASPGVHKAVLLLVFSSFVFSGCATYKTAWKTVAIVRDCGTLADKTIASVVEQKHNSCVVAHGEKTQEYADCIKDYKAALDAWRNIARPAINTSLVTTVAALQVAEKTGDKKLDWKALLKDGACALARSVIEWKPLLGSRYSEVAQAAGFVEVFSCK